MHWCVEKAYSRVLQSYFSSIDDCFDIDFYTIWLLLWSVVWFSSLCFTVYMCFFTCMWYLDGDVRSSWRPCDFFVVYCCCCCCCYADIMACFSPPWVTYVFNEAGNNVVVDSFKLTAGSSRDDSLWQCTSCSFHSVAWGLTFRLQWPARRPVANRNYTYMILLKYNW